MNKLHKPSKVRVSKDKKTTTTKTQRPSIRSKSTKARRSVGNPSISMLNLNHPLSAPSTLSSIPDRVTAPINQTKSKFSSASSTDQITTAPIISSISTDPKANLFTALPPKPVKTPGEEKIGHLPNFINTEYESGKKPIMSMTLDELTTSIQELGLPKFRAKQIFNWVYKSGISDFSEMRNLSRNDIDVLQKNFFIYPIDLKYVATATDATRKYIFQVEKKGAKIDTIESVFIPRVWNRLYGQDETTPLDEWDIPSTRGSRGQSDENPEDDDEDAAVGGVAYDVSTFVEYRKAYLARTGQQLEAGELNTLNIVPNLSLAASAEALVNSATSIANGQKPSSKAPLLTPKTMKKGHLFIPDFLQASPNSSQPHLFDQSKYQYEKGAVCFSSQIGCSLSCSFCHTGTIDKQNVRNLSAGEILSQIMAIKQDLNDFKGRRPFLHGEQNEPGTIVSSVVGMGQGEPGYNIKNLLRAISILNSEDGLNMGRRHITISTSGVVTAIDKLAETFPVNLAISLHAVTDEVRDKIMPINKIFNLEALMSSIRRYPAVKKTRAVTFEYIMLAGVNDSEADARELLRLVKGVPSLVNLIPFNEWPGCGHESSSAARIRKFQEIINATSFESGVRCTVRRNRGRSEQAACGTLNSSIGNSLLRFANANNKTEPNLAHLVQEATRL